MDFCHQLSYISYILVCEFSNSDIFVFRQKEAEAAEEKPASYMDHIGVHFFIHGCGLLVWIWIR